MQGKHGNGMITLCGKNYQWTDMRYKHEKDCDECQELKVKNEDKPDFPNPLGIQTLSQKKETTTSSSSLCNVQVQKLL